MTGVVRPLLFGLALAVTVAGACGGAVACGPQTDCMIGERSYRIAVPDGPGPHGAIIFMHGYRGTAAGVVASESLRRVADELGVVLVAPKSGGEDWLIRNAPRKGFATDERELEYFDALRAELIERFDVDPNKLLASGFSAGGMMTWTLACHRGDAFAAFAPISGTFWAPIPQSCPSEPVDLVHIHGRSDGVVPIAGRPIADTRQGDVDAVIEMVRSQGGYGALEPVATDGLGLDCSGTANAAGRELLYCLHDGGHEMRAEWVRWAYVSLVAGD